ncbi:hypothetical protein MTO96_025139 [Rhipicephalus appendiculatus]
MVSSGTKMSVLVLWAVAVLFGQMSYASVTLRARSIRTSEDSRESGPHSDVKHAVRITARPLDLLGSTASGHSYAASSASGKIAPASNMTLLHNRRVARGNDKEGSPSNKAAGAVYYDASKRHNFGLNSTGHAVDSRGLFKQQATSSPNLSFRRGEHDLRSKPATNNATHDLKQQQDAPRYSRLHVGASKTNSRNLGQESKKLGESSSGAVAHSKEK